MTYRDEVLAQLRWSREHRAENSASPRVDSVRNRLETTIGLLDTVLRELPDLHVLATDRAAARREAMVSGGERDYALDNHGDAFARLIYKLVALGALDACEILDDVAHDVIQVLRKGEINGRRTRPSASLEEVALALVNQRKQTAQGGYAPVRAEAQPSAEQAAKALRVEDLVRERDRYKRRVESLEARLARRNGHGGRQRAVG